MRCTALWTSRWDVVDVCAWLLALACHRVLLSPVVCVGPSCLGWVSTRETESERHADEGQGEMRVETSESRDVIAIGGQQ